MGAEQFIRQVQPEMILTEAGGDDAFGMFPALEYLRLVGCCIEKFTHPADFNFFYLFTDKVQWVSLGYDVRENGPLGVILDDASLAKIDYAPLMNKWLTKQQQGIVENKAGIL